MRFQIAIKNCAWQAYGVPWRRLGWLTPDCRHVPQAERARQVDPDERVCTFSVVSRKCPAQASPPFHDSGGIHREHRDQIALFEIDADEDVGRRHRSEQQMASVIVGVHQKAMMKPR